MKTKNIFKTLVLAAVLVSACSKNEIDNDFKGYTLPVTINVTRQGDEPATRATYNESTKKLEFSTGDKLFVKGNDYDAGDFAGTLDYDAVSGKFSGTVTIEKNYTGTIGDLMASAYAFLLPDGYGSYGVVSIVGSGYETKIYHYLNKAFALTKAAAVEQFSVELATSYGISGFALAPRNAIVSFTISGLTANKEVAVSFDTNGTGVISGNVTTNATGVATFAVGVLSGCTLEDCTLTVDGNNIAMPTKTTEAGHIYNISRSAAPATDLSTIFADYEAKNGETLTGTLANNVKISIADGATVMLKDVNINGSGTWTSGDYAGITCAGDATIILEGDNTVKGFYEDYPGIQVPVDKTLTIQGTGSLNASSNGYGAGIGGGYGISCGNIVIKGGTINANGGSGCSGIGMGTGDLTCGTITISGGDITANGGTNGAGIGIGSGGYDGASSCGAITISGGTVKATGGNGGAGIGSGHNGAFGASSCGAITISGGTVEATGGSNAAGIGSGHNEGAGTSSCGTITITSGVNNVTATKGSGAPNSIGAGKGSSEVTVKIEDPSKVTQN